MDEHSALVALITGGTTGLGKAIAAELSRRGWKLAIQHDPSVNVAAPPAPPAPAAGEAASAGQIEHFTADITDAEQREQLVENVIESFDRIDMLVNAAPGAATAGEDLLEVSEDSFLEALGTCTAPAFFLTQLVASEMVRMVEAGLIEDPKIITLNTLSSYATSADQGATCLAQAALSMMTRLFADRLGEHGINVYEVRVGIIASGADDQAHARYDALVEQGLTPLRRLGHPGDVARAVAAIADDLLSFSTGQVIEVDGGFHLRRL